MDEENITDKTEIKWGGGYIAAEFKCECGKKIITFTSMPSLCSCGIQYWVACRVMKKIEEKQSDHGCECRCIECDLSRDKYQTKFENKHNY